MSQRTRFARLRLFTLLALGAPVLPLFGQTVGVALGASSGLNAEPGSKVAVPILVDLAAAGNRNIASLQATIAWTAARLTFDSVRVAPGLDWTVTANTTQATGGTVVVSAFGTSALPASGPVATLYYTAGTVAGGTRLTLQVDAAGNEAGQSIGSLVMPRAAAVCVAPTGTYGDTNNDATVNIIDAQQVARFGVGLSVANSTALQARGDVNADGAVNVIDAQQIARFSVSLSAAPRINTALYTPPAANSVVASGAQTIGVGLTRLVSAQPRASDGSDLAGCRPVTWSSADSSIATVSTDGLVTARGPGTTTIIATSSGKTATTAITVTPISPVHRTIVTGFSHSCALTTGGQAYCWGDNSRGQLGNGTTVASATPVLVSGGLSFVSLTAGSVHSCGLTSAGAAYCWGSGGLGELGSGGTSDVNVPTPVSGSVSLVTLSAGRTHTCGLTAKGEVWCWGAGATNGGQLGTGTISSSTVPVRGAVGFVFRRLDAGNLHTCGVTVAGVAYCWGWAQAGRLGAGPAGLSNSPSPLSFASSEQFADIVGSAAATCGLAVDGGIFCNDINGELVRVADRGAFQALAPAEGNAAHNCAIDGERRLRCWGNSGAGQIRSVLDGVVTAPVSTYFNDTPVAAASTGGDQTCTLSDAGAASCWGANQYGQLGDGSTTVVSAPTQVTGVPVFTSLAAGISHTCGLTSAGVAHCWGNGRYGQLGDGQLSIRHTAAAVTGAQFSALFSGANHLCGLTLGAGTALCWGRNSHGQLGDGTYLNQTIPTALPTGERFIRISGGVLHTCALAPTGATSCWGSNWNGTLGIASSDTTSRVNPVLVSGGHTFSTLHLSTSGSGYGCGLTSVGNALCWGANGVGQLGNGTTTAALAPTPVSGSLSFASLSLGSGSTCGLTAAGVAFCWGSNTVGQIGDGTTSPRTTPTAVTGGLTFSALAVSLYTTCGLRTGGGLSCWGGDALGRAQSNSPASVSTYAALTSIVAGLSHFCGLDAAGSTWCWGSNDSGQLGQPFITGVRVVQGGLAFRVP
jgi:alpha-tubulin suppressor-like RCC1 family protein